MHLLVIEANIEKHSHETNYTEIFSSAKEGNLLNSVSTDPIMVKSVHYEHEFVGKLTISTNLIKLVVWMKESTVSAIGIILGICFDGPLGALKCSIQGIPEM